MRRVTIGMFAHVDAGKTTLAEQLLYHTQSIRDRGRVDHQDAYLDSHDIERQRGITIFADQAVMTYEDTVYYLIDTPGHVDFSPEMERALQVMDGAVLIISAVEGVQGHTETVWQLLRKHRIPTFVFINKIDRVGADVKRVMAEIRSYLTDDACLLTGGLTRSEIGQEVMEFMAERDEQLLDQYLRGETSYDDWLHALRQMVQACRIYPCASGSALHDDGIQPFLEQLHLLIDTDYEAQAAFGGRIYKIRYDDKGVRYTYVKALSGTLHVRDELTYETDDGLLTEKITQLYRVNGSKLEAVSQIQAGDLFALTGLTAAKTGQGLGTCKDHAEYDMVPLLKAKVEDDGSRHVKEVLKVFEVLDAEDPSLNVVWEEQLKELHIHIMGVIQLEVLQQLIEERFQLKVTFGTPQILYKETIQSPVRGYGHFEPLRHYAEVHLQLEPGERGSGISFASVCHVNELSTAHQRLIEQHIFEREHHGLLTGMPITDMKITLLKGAVHQEHTQGGDLREATFRAIRQGLEKADNVLLEPYYHFRIRVDLDDMGKVLADIQRLHGEFDPPQTSETHAVITGRAPVATFMHYSTELASLTHGRGSLHMTFAGYDRCHNEQEVIERIGYRKDADPLYTSSSIFCAKGAGYSVPWDQAEALMHLL